MKAIGETDVLDLIGRIYDAGTSFALWPDTLTHLADALGAREAALGAMASDALPWMVAPRTDPEQLRLYAEAYHPLNHVFHRITRRGVGRPATDAMVMPRDELVKSAYHAEWAQPQGYSTVLGGMVLAEQGWRTVLMLPGRDAFGRDQLRLLELLMPHIQRAVQLNIRMGEADASDSATARLVEQMPTAAFILDSNGQVLFANPAAEQLLCSGRGVRRAQGKLTTARLEDADRLQALIRRCAEGVDGGGGDLRLAQGQEPDLLLQFVPIRREIPLLSASLPVAIVFEAGRRPPSDPGERLRAKYGLTPAEAAFALEIAKGDGKRAAAERRGISFSTARTHLSRIFEKTGAHRQAELVRLLIADLGQPAVA
ncbi:MAG: helix-turn-helix transcriptional regulator [Phenylobacterium sp.]|uniref:helix-turn-helix transcriptional regulator n=1 Tax=Phenylobacterium sp. TaxID=1871053 RepID=UPI0012164EF1|nr:PAS domain-containing protein [Phenylobacterium sp.]TAJ73282.1 MAG: helix-turn-helix transcriptional regulator [Phenylobacterium sp.]